MDEKIISDATRVLLGGLIYLQADGQTIRPHGPATMTKLPPTLAGEFLVEGPAAIHDGVYRT